MGQRIAHAVVLSTSIVTLAVGSALLAQTTQAGLAQLGLTEMSARNFVMGEIKSAATGRRSDIAVFGTRAFLKLPGPARGPAATALLAWAKGYVNSPAFKTAYDAYRKTLVPPTQQYDLTIEEEVKQKLGDELAGAQQLRQVLPTFPPAEQAKLLQTIEQQEAWARNPETARTLHAQIEAARAERDGQDSAVAKEANEKYPADPQKIFARRLRDFLDSTVEVNFSARTISLTGGPDGVEFVERQDRMRSWQWQEAAIVGPDATAAARAAAGAWLREIER